MPIPLKTEPQVPQTARQRVYSQLKKWIVNGTLTPEEKISDLELANYFSVSRTPVREAMQLLADQRLIQIFPGKESRVAPIDLEQARYTYQLTAQLYATAVEFAFPFIKESDCLGLEKLNQKFAWACNQRDYEQAHMYDRQFHSYFLNVCPNDFLSSFLDTVDCHVERIETLYFKNLGDIRSDSVTQHNAIIRAFREHDLEKTVAATKHNWLQTLDILGD